MDVKKQPYEFLVRYEGGKIKGAHVKWLTIVTDDEGKQSAVEGEAMPVDVGAGKGFPVADILNQIHVDALATVEAKDGELREARTENADLCAQIAKLKEGIDI